MEESFNREKKVSKDSPCLLRLYFSVCGHRHIWNWASLWWVIFFQSSVWVTSRRLNFLCNLLSSIKTRSFLSIELPAYSLPHIWIKLCSTAKYMNCAHTNHWWWESWTSIRFYLSLLLMHAEFGIDWLIDWLIDLWLCWVFVSVRGLSLVVASGGHSSSRCAGLSLSWPLLLRSTGSRRAGSAIVAHGLSRSAACGIFPDQGSNPCPLHWQADSQPLRHQGSPGINFEVFNLYCYSHAIQQLQKKPVILR